MALSCFFAAVFVSNVPRFLRFPVFGFFFREYSRYLPDFSFLIMVIPLHGHVRKFYTCLASEHSQGVRNSRALNCKATASVPNQGWQAERPPYKGSLKRFEKPSARSATRIARLVAR